MSESASALRGVIGHCETSTFRVLADLGLQIELLQLGKAASTTRGVLKNAVPNRS